MKIGSLVNDKRCNDPKFGKAGIILAVVGNTCWVMWPNNPEMPLWADKKVLEVVSEC